MNKYINIGNKTISNEDKTFIVAEIGANHNGDIKLAKEMIKAAAECGVDAVKFQTYTSHELLADNDRELSYTSNGKQVKQTIGELFDNVSLNRNYHKELFDYAHNLGLEVFSTPFSLEGAEFLNNLNVPCFKIAASDVNYVDMLEKIAQYKKPVILSLGKCTLGEADQAINLLFDNGCKELIIMHCVAQYPSPIDEMNLNTIKTLKQLYPECIVGFSDHSLGITAAIGAVAFGAKMIEKHFTLNKKLEGPDHWFSMDPTDMKKMVAEIRHLELALGKSRKMILDCEKKERNTSVRSLVLNRRFKKNEIIKTTDLVMLRPGWGISPFDKNKVVGMKVNQDCDKNTVLTWDLLK